MMRLKFTEKAAKLHANCIVELYLITFRCTQYYLTIFAVKDLLFVYTMNLSS
jgi:hypothetical protein